MNSLQSWVDIFSLVMDMDLSGSEIHRNRKLTSGVTVVNSSAIDLLNGSGRVMGRAGIDVAVPRFSRGSCYLWREDMYAICD